MRLKIYLSFLVVFISLGLSAQDDRSFTDFLKLFPGKTIGPEDQMTFLGIEGPFTEERLAFEKRTAKQIVSSSNNYVLLSVKYDCTAGGFCESVNLYAFTKNGELISEVEVEKSYGDCGFKNSVETLLLNDSLLITRSYKWTGDCNGDITTSEAVRINTYGINESGLISLSREQKVDLSRLYHRVSSEFLSKEELKTLSKQELATMRNELFASYGYRFKTQEWIDYFENLMWYKPTRDVVNESELTLIERINLALIKSLEINE